MNGFERPAWQQRAACRGMMLDPHAPNFFPAQGGDTETPKKVCAGCPVQAECGDYANQWPMTRLFGIWGGGSQKSRSELRAVS